MAGSQPHIIYTGQSQAQAMAYSPYDRPVAVAVAENAMGDPAMRQYVRQQAVEMGGHAMIAARYYGHRGVMAFQDYIQQGPKGIATLCFLGGVASSVVGCMNVLNVFGSVTEPFHYILSAYMFAFGIATACIEADTDRVGMLVAPFDALAEPITRAQAWLHEECRLLTTLRGRGFFYLYQGTLMVTQCVFCMLFLCGLYSAFMGVLCVLMSFGIKPDIEGAVASAGLCGSRYDGLPAEDGGLAAAGPTSQNQAMAVPAMPQHSNAPAQAHVVEFSKAEAAWRQSKDQLPGKTCRELWALYQQGTEGDCTVPKPSGMFNGNAKEQWRLWKGLHGVSPEDAKIMFVERLRKDGVDV